MGTSATAAKVRYNLKNYDRVSLRFRKGMKEFLEDMALQKGCSVNQYILDSVFKEFSRSYNRDFAVAVLRECVKYLAVDLKGNFCSVYLEGYLVDGNWMHGFDAKLVIVLSEVDEVAVAVVTNFVDFCNENINDAKFVKSRKFRVPRIVFRVVGRDGFSVGKSMRVLYFAK